MSKRQDRKPDYLRELDAAILDNLAGIKINTVGLAGDLKEIEAVQTLCGYPFEGYFAKIETPRRNGKLDEVAVAFKVEAALTLDGEPLEEQEITVGSRLLITGVIQTIKDFTSGRVLVYVLADYVGIAEHAEAQDEVALRGVIANEPVHRIAPRGKRITDIFIRTKNELTGGKCYIPCVCWQEAADEVATWQQGDTVAILGRYQSRQYEKLINKETGERERRTAYELSARMIRREEQAADEEQNAL